MTISREAKVRLLVAATIVIITVVLVVFFRVIPPLPKGPGPSQGPTTDVMPPTPRKGPPYANCDAAHADGRYNIPRGDPAYNPALDRDGDGIACDR